MAGGDAEQRAETGLAMTAAVEAEHEFVEVGLEVFAAQAMIDAQRPGFEIGKDAVCPGQHDMSGHFADRMGIVVDAGRAGIARPAIRLGGSTGDEIGSQERMQTGGRVIGHFLETNTAGTGPVICHLGRTNDEDFALMTASAAAGRGIIFAAAGDLGLIDFDETAQWVAIRRYHAGAQLGAEQPSRFIGAQGELLLQLQGGDPVGMRRHQISGPEPQGQRQLGAVQDGSSGHRGLLAATGTFVSPRLGLQEPSFSMAAAGADKALRPAHRGEIGSASRFIRETLLELDQGARNVGHGDLWSGLCS